MKTLGCLALAAVIAACVSGCSSGPALGDVKGTVTLDGKPLAKGSIRFETTGARPATAQIENGQIIEATTYQPGDGVPVGTHKIAIFANADASSAVVPDPGKAGPTPGANYMSGKSLIPEHYSDPEKSGLTAEIKRGENIVEFKLASQ
jgi:hypothetical protein